MWDADSQSSTFKRCVHKTLSPESLQMSDSVGVLEPRSSTHKTDVFEIRPSGSNSEGKVVGSDVSAKSVQLS
jgi:hypothetical protein